MARYNRKLKIEKICLFCGRIFYVCPSFKMQKLCSKKCEVKNRSNVVSSKKGKEFVPREIRYCECGCGQEIRCKITSKRRFIFGHWRKDKRWNKGLTKETDERVRKNGISISEGKKDAIKFSVEHLSNLKKAHNTKSYKENGLRKALNAQNRRPTSYEMKIESLIIENNLPYKYVGNGKFYIEGKNPDFVNVNGDKILLEVYAKWRHSINYELERDEFFNSYGYKTVFIDETDIKSDNWKEVCLNKILIGGKR